MILHRLPKPCLVAVVAFAWNAHAGQIEPDAKAITIVPAISPWHLSVGYVWRNLGNVDFVTDARAQRFSIPAMDMSNKGRAGSASGFGGHAYFNGFVNNDVSGPTSGATWFWGYTSASQLEGSDLAFRGTATFFRERIAALDNPGWSSDMAGGGPILSVSWDTALPVPGMRVGAEFSASLIQADAAQSLNTLRVDQMALNARVTDHYTVDPLAIPGAPFGGTFAGPGPIIPSSPSSRQIKSVGNANDGNTTSYFDDVREGLDVTLTTLSLGPTASYGRGPVTASAGLGLALNVTSWDADKTDTLYRRRDGSTSVLKQWHDHDGGSDVLPGFYLQASVAYAFDKQWSVQAFGRYDWSQELQGAVGGSTFSLDLTGWSVGGGVVYRF